MNCKYCDKKGKYSLGWLDAKGEWQDKYLACDDHVVLSLHQQDFRMSMEMMRERSKLFSQPKTLLHFDTNP